MILGSTLKNDDIGFYYAFIFLAGGSKQKLPSGIFLIIP